MKYFASILTFVTAVAAHGYVSSANIGGNAYTFYQPYSDPYKNPKINRISRPISSNGPVENVSGPEVQCGTGRGFSAPAPLHAEAAAGSDVKLYWTQWPDSHMGPTITYMAKCLDSGCNNWSPDSQAVWFKIQEQGRQGTSNNWATTPLMKAGGVFTYTIPSCITSGYYLVRHEIIALHSASKYPGAQLYPHCHQLKVTGGGSINPSNLVSFPGAYKSSDPGITFNLYKPQAYIIPGPKLFSCKTFTIWHQSMNQNRKSPL